MSLPSAVRCIDRYRLVDCHDSCLFFLSASSKGPTRSEAKTIEINLSENYKDVTEKYGLACCSVRFQAVLYSRKYKNSVGHLDNA